MLLSNFLVCHIANQTDFANQTEYANQLFMLILLISKLPLAFFDIQSYWLEQRTQLNILSADYPFVLE